MTLNTGSAVYAGEVTVLDVIQRSTSFLARKGVESPRLQAELLLAHVLNLPRMQLYLNFERDLTVPEQDTLRELVRRRGEREPLQHIVGSTNFCGLEMEVNRDVLVPRPETELLAEQGWKFLNERFGTGAVSMPPEAPSASLKQGPAVLDFGTGSGCVAVALAVNCLTAGIIGLDISAAALAVAGRNAERHGVAHRIQNRLGDGFSALANQASFDLITANPPYISTAEIATLEPEVRDYDPRRALDGGPEGLDFYIQLARGAAQFMRPGAKIMMEFGDGQAERIEALFHAENWIVEQILNDYTQRPRILIARGKI